MSERYKRDELGTRMKTYEFQANSSVLLPNLPVIIRLDGNNFSKFTKNFERPFDLKFSQLMMDTTEFLVKNFNKTQVGYTQSDEITLVMHNSYENPIEFSGRIQKLCSIIASKCTCFFALRAKELFPEKLIGEDSFPVFDCRIWNVPDLVEASNTVLWREFDATKNSIQMAAQKHLGHKKLQGVSGKKAQELLLLEADINWNDYPEHFKKGTYFVRYKNSLDKTVVEKLVNTPPLHKIPLEERLNLLFRDLITVSSDQDNT